MNHFKKYYIFTIVSLIIAFIDGAFVYVTFLQAKKMIDKEVIDLAENYFSTFNVAYQSTQQNMLQISSLVANDSTYGSLFLKGKRAVESEGGGGGKLASKIARKHLYNSISGNWKQFSKQFNARQLHFHLGAGSISFLRVHKPAKFGDNMDQVRHTIVEANKEQHQVVGFETGRVYSGIRGVSPVFVINENGIREHVGAVEAGASFSAVFDNINEIINVEIAVLLNVDHLRQNVWPEYLDKRLNTTPEINNLVLEATTSEQINLLRRVRTNNQHNIKNPNLDVKVLSLAGKKYLYAKQPLRDFRASANSDLPNSGQVVVWKDITQTFNEFNDNFRISIYFALLAFLIIEALIFTMFNCIRKHLTKVIDKQVSDISVRAIALDMCPNFIAIIDVEGNIEYVNSKAEETTGYTQQELIGSNMSIFSSGHTPLEIYEQLWDSILSGVEWKGKLLNVRKNGALYWAENIVSPRFEQGQIHSFILSQQDVTESHNYNEKVLHDSLHDPLTGLMNRRAFEDQMSSIHHKIKKKNEKYVLLFIDLDYFKRVNDECGHQAGDLVLKDISGLTNLLLRNGDSLFRLGGDEFSIILEKCELLGGKNVAEKICSEIQSYEFLWKNKRYFIGASIGVTPISVNDHNWENTINRADKACYQAKAEGRNRVVISDK